MDFSTIDEWLSWIASVHFSDIELGLDRIQPVAQRLGVLTFSCPIIIVGGTNGKGSTVAGLGSIYQRAGYHVGMFTSPVFLKHNEQVCIDGNLASDEKFCAAFEKIEQARETISLTPFEFHTLAALLIFKTYSLDVLILEVGLGGRLDAVNILDADMAIVTSIDIDHAEWLGSTRSLIAHEKAGIFRKKQLAICGDNQPPHTLIDDACKIDAKLFCQGRDFYYRAESDSWSWYSKNTVYTGLPQTSLALQNMSTVLMAVTLFQDRLPVSRFALFEGLAKAKLRGRIEVVNEPVRKIYDVAHNPAAVTMLAAYLKKYPIEGKTYALFSMLSDKDIGGSLEAIQERIDSWYVGPLLIKRGSTLETLQHAFNKVGIRETYFFSSLTDAYHQVLQKTQTGDRLVIFGSFHTIAEILLITPHSL